MNPQIDQPKKFEPIILEDGTELSFDLKRNDKNTWVKILTQRNGQKTEEFFGFYGNPLCRYQSAEEVITGITSGIIQCKELSDLYMFQKISIFSETLEFPGGRIVTHTEDPESFPLTVAIEQDKNGQMFEITRDLYWELHDYLIENIVNYDNVWNWLVEHGLIDAEI